MVKFKSHDVIALEDADPSYGWCVFPLVCALRFEGGASWSSSWFHLLLTQTPDIQCCHGCHH